MRWIYAFIVVAMLAGPVAAQTPQATNNCAPGERIDGSTADQAKRKIEAAGFRDVHDLKKGCDNVWHGKATKESLAVYVAVLPDGQVVQEGG